MKKAKPTGETAPPKRRFQYRARQDADKAELKQRIIKVARREFAKRDPSSVSIRKIAAAAGYSQGTIYQYFEDRRDLLIAVKIDGYESLYHQLLEIERSVSDSKRRLKEMFLAYLRFWNNNPNDFRVIFSMTETAEERRRKSGQTFADTEVSRGTSKAFMRAVGSFLADRGCRFDRKTIAAMTSTLYSAVQGTISTRLQMPTLKWPESEVMGELVLDAILDSWSSKAAKAAQREPAAPLSLFRDETVAS